MNAPTPISTPMNVAAVVKEQQEAEVLADLDEMPVRLGHLLADDVE